MVNRVVVEVLTKIYRTEYIRADGSTLGVSWWFEKPEWWPGPCEETHEDGTLRIMSEGEAQWLNGELTMRVQLPDDPGGLTAGGE